MKFSSDEFSEWEGRKQSSVDTIGQWPAQALAATLNRDDRFDSDDPVSLPAPWHWLYFLPTARASQIDTDGHPRKGDFLPPVPLPRRMWAGSRIDYHSPLHIGDRARKQSTIKKVTPKEGASGQLVFVTVQHDIFVQLVGGEERLAISEQQDIVYRKPAGKDSNAPKPQPAPDNAQFQRTIKVDPVCLFRYSALTFNAHRIHYDRDYATQVEGYPGLVVHGPLTATLLLNMLRDETEGEILEKFSFRALSPITDIQDVTLAGYRNGEELVLWATDSTGTLAMKAHATMALGK